MVSRHGPVFAPLDTVKAGFIAEKQERNKKLWVGKRHAIGWRVGSLSRWSNRGWRRSRYEVALCMELYARCSFGVSFLY
jgi:hypothetical protein